ncbi:hypothetical protein [Paraburkholderia megapolitana]|uniref:hypothetical protein n=1 Tax=Paraburkholderia megapolitana TaxID=420953 RepID=UPI0038B76B99
MTAPRSAPTLQLLNRTAQPARARLLCANHMVWDVWVTAMGAVTAPAFVPPWLTLEARVTERRTQVTYLSIAVGARSDSAIVARLEQRNGARFFALDTQEATVAGALQLINRSDCPLDFSARYSGSPYVLTGFVNPGAALQVAYSLLDLVVVQNGCSTQRSLPTPDGAWVITSPPETAGFPALERLDAREVADLASGYR